MPVWWPQGGAAGLHAAEFHKPVTKVKENRLKYVQELMSDEVLLNKSTTNALNQSKWILFDIISLLWCHGAVCWRERKTPSQRLHSSSAAEEMGHWSREEDALHGMADIICELWEEKVDNDLYLEHIYVYLLSGWAGAPSEDRGDVPVLLQAGPARCGTGNSGGGPGGRQRRTDPRQEGGRVVLLWRIWLVLCFGQVSATPFILIPEEEYRLFIESRIVSLFVNNPSGVVLNMQNIKNDLQN